MTNPRYSVDPDPAWDLGEVRDGVFTVELSWIPDALAGRLDEIVASPKLVEALEAAGITGYTTSPAHGFYNPDAFGVGAETPAPELVQLQVGSDESADLSYLRGTGLVASQRAVEVIQAFCEKAVVELLPPAT